LLLSWLLWLWIGWWPTNVTGTKFRQSLRLWSFDWRI
jgi:hypothetical protein